MPTGGFDYSMMLWDLEMRHEVVRLQEHGAPVNAVAFRTAGWRRLMRAEMPLHRIPDPYGRPALVRYFKHVTMPDADR